MKRILFFILITFFGLSLFAQEYEIKVKIHGVSDTLVYLGHHFGEKKFVIDTTTIDANGNAVFKGDKELEKGIYLVVMPSRGMTYFEILVTDKKKFTVETDTTNFVENMKFKGCKENIVFNEYQRKMADIQEERMALNKEYEAAGEDADAKKAISDKMTKLNEDRIEYMDNLVKKDPDSFFAKILLSMKDVVIPDPPKDENGVITDSTFQYRYYKEHYFDYIDFSENGLLRTPIFEGKVNYYFDKMIVPLPDSLIRESSKLIRVAYEAGDSLMYQFTASHLLHYFEASKIMGYDAVFVAIAEEWYLSGKAPWADSTFMSKLEERVEKITPTRLGSIAYNLERMQSVDDKYYTLHQVEADYTVLVFFEPNCGHCKKEVPKLMQHYRDSLKEMNVKIFAFYTQYDKEEWKVFLDDKDLHEDGWMNIWDGPYPHSGFRDFYDIYSTPVVYVLDKNKKIIGKRINVENIKDLIEFEQKRAERESQE